MASPWLSPLQRFMVRKQNDDGDGEANVSLG